MESTYKTIMVRTVFLSMMLAVLCGSVVLAQDTTKRKMINITSTFKPALKESVKINFSAVPPASDTAKPRLVYHIPSQYLFLSYQPTAMKPLALVNDSTVSWQNDDYIKIGFGNVHQPYLKAGFSFGDGKSTFFNVFGDLYTAKGTLPYQKNDMEAVGLAGTVKTKKNLEWDGKLGFRGDGYYLYGYQPDTLKFNKSDLQQRFQTFEGKLGLRNMIPTEFGLTYNPNLAVSVFSDNHNPKATETNSVLNLPLQKSIGSHFAFNLGFTADLTHYSLNNNSVYSAQNNLYYVSPALIYKSENFSLQAEVTPSWDQKAFNLLPNFLADVHTSDQSLSFQAGWIGYYEKGSYERFASINPWLAQPNGLRNTRVQEFFGGIKGSLNNHVTYSAKAGVNQYWNIPLFVNDSLDGKTFVVRYESNLQSFEMHGEIGYNQGEQFSAKAALTINQFLKLQDEAKAWGLIPVEFTTDLRWQVLKDLWLKADLWAFEGAAYRSPDGSAHYGNGGFDLDGGVEFRITRMLNLWFQMNNILNDKYQRWHQYPVYGFNFLGGIIFSFNTK
jgi:hypothetical protein